MSLGVRGTLKSCPGINHVHILLFKEKKFKETFYMDNNGHFIQTIVDIHIDNNGDSIQIIMDILYRQ